MNEIIHLKREIKKMEEMLKELEYPFNLKFEIDILDKKIKLAILEGDEPKELKYKEEQYEKKAEYVRFLRTKERKSTSINLDEFIETEEIPILECVKCGIKVIDDNLGGLPKSTFIQFAARSYAGKTTMMHKMMSEIAKTSKIIYFDFEMGKYHLLRRLPKYFKTKTQRENTLLNFTSNYLDDLLLEIEYQADNGYEFFFIDSKMEIRTDESDIYKSSTKIALELGELCRKLGITIFLINQMSEETIKGNDFALKGGNDQMYKSDLVFSYQLVPILDEKGKVKKDETGRVMFYEDRRKLKCEKNRHGRKFEGLITIDEVLPEPNYEQTQAKVIEPQIDMPNIPL